MCLNLNDYLFKTRRSSYRSIYMNPVVTTNQKPTTDIQKLERKEHKRITKENNQITRGETKRTTKITRKQATKGSKYIPINNHCKCQ